MELLFEQHPGWQHASPHPAYCAVGYELPSTLPKSLGPVTVSHSALATVPVQRSGGGRSVPAWGGAAHRRRAAVVPVEHHLEGALQAALAQVVSQSQQPVVHGLQRGRREDPEPKADTPAVTRSTRAARPGVRGQPDSPSTVLASSRLAAYMCTREPGPAIPGFTGSVLAARRL